MVHFIFILLQFVQQIYGNIGVLKKKKVVLSTITIFLASLLKIFKYTHYQSVVLRKSCKQLYLLCVFHFTKRQTRIFSWKSFE